MDESNGSGDLENEIYRNGVNIQRGNELTHQSLDVSNIYERASEGVATNEEISAFLHC